MNLVVLEAVVIGAFMSAEPFPWCALEGVLSVEGFEALCATFPPLALFERHEGLKRGYGQRPHNRWYLAYESSIYHDQSTLGTATRADLEKPWQDFIDELEGRSYRELVCSLLGLDDVEVRYAWHVGTTGSEVSPHVDASDKAGTHIFYFNDPSGWDPAWGGQMLVLGGRATARMNPDFTDFAATTEVDTIGNRSFLFANGPDAWHGVRPLTAPTGAGRRLFNVIFEHRGSSTHRAVKAVQVHPRRSWLPRVVRHN